MSNLAIRAIGLSKEYEINRVAPTLNLTDKDTTRQKPRLHKDVIWALRDISFEVQHGQVLGIIGKNGSGKSTLLKIISHLTDPSRGYVEVTGKVGSLLEVGTGFHPELSGRENVFLNGSILGMPRKEIARRFDEIVAFSEIEDYIDTPVKYYSSGMYMRLAFSVASSMDADILLVDEVLAVGDTGFQRKCLDRIYNLATEGRTILFVSHNANAVMKLCDSVIVLEKGQLVYSGDPDHAVRRYLEDFDIFRLNPDTDFSLKDRTDRKGNGELRFTRIEFRDQNDRPVKQLTLGEPAKICLFYEASQAYENTSVLIAFNIYNEQGTLITNINSQDIGKTRMPLAQEGYFECFWKKVNLRPGSYTSALYCGIDGIVADWIQSGFRFRVEPGDFFGLGVPVSGMQGDVLTEYDWISRTQIFIQQPG